MCFNEDADWFAGRVDEWVNDADVPTRCDECAEMIPVGGEVHHTFLYEYDPDDSEEEEAGETYQHKCCDGCHKFIKAIIAAEKEEGCTGIGVRPPLGAMVEAVAQAGAAEVRRYVKRALVMFPELRDTGYITQIARQLLT